MDNCITLWVCVDCLVCAAGTADENPDTAAHLPVYRAAVENVSRVNSGVEIYAHPGMAVHECEDLDGFRDDDCNCETVTFSWSRCELCSSPLGGSRHAITLWLEPVKLLGQECNCSNPYCQV